MTFDTVIRNGTAVIPGQGEVAATVAIQDGKVAALLNPADPAEGREVIDARGKHIFPGAIDPHVHVAYMGAPIEQYETETRSATVGGVTTYINFLVRPGELDTAYQAEIAGAEPISYIDFALHFGTLSEHQVENLPRYVEQYGVTSFKYHMNYRFNPDPAKDSRAARGFVPVDDGLLWDLFSTAAKIPGVVVNVHCETGDIPMRMEARIKASGMEGQAAWNATRPPFVEGNAVRTACYLASNAGATLYIVHMSTRDGLDEVRRARQSHKRIYVETCPQYFTLHTESGHRPSQKIPPIRPKDQADAVWEGILDGTVDTIATDHGGRPAQGGPNPSIWDVGPSFAGVATMLPLMLSEGHHKRGLSLQRVAELTSYNTARIFNLYPRKGTIQPGSDADLAIVDLSQERTVEPAYCQSESDFSLWEGWKVKGWPVRTIVRGQTVMLDGKVVGTKGFGRYLRRQPSPIPTPPRVTAG